MTTTPTTRATRKRAPQERTLYIVDCYRKCRGKSVGISAHGGGEDLFETIHYCAPPIESCEVVTPGQGGLSYCPVLVWADSDEAAYQQLRRYFGCPVSGRTYLRRYRVSAATVAEVHAYYRDRDLAEATVGRMAAGGAW